MKSKRTLKARDIERLENTTPVTALQDVCAGCTILACTCSGCSQQSCCCSVSCVEFSCLINTVVGTGK